MKKIAIVIVWVILWVLLAVGSYFARAQNNAPPTATRYVAMIMGQATNPIIFLNSTIYVYSSNLTTVAMGTNLYAGTYTNVVTLPSSSGAFGLWFQVGGSNYLTMNNPQWNIDAASTFSFTIGVQTNHDSDNNLIGIDNIENGGLTPSNTWQFTGWFWSLEGANAGLNFPWPVEMNYGAPVAQASSPYSASTNVWYVSSRFGSDLFDGHSTQTPKALLPITAAIATNQGTVINMLGGYQANGAFLYPQVSVIGPGAISNLCWINGDVTPRGNCTIANLAFYSVGQLVSQVASGGPQWDTNGPTTIRDCKIDAGGNEPFWNELGGNQPVLPYPLEFLNDDIYGAGTIVEYPGFTNVLFQGCNFRQSPSAIGPGSPSGKAPLYNYAGIWITGGGFQFEGCHFIQGPSNVFEDFMIGNNNAFSGNSWTNLWGQGNTMFTNYNPGVAFVTNASTQKLGTF